MTYGTTHTERAELERQDRAATLTAEELEELRAEEERAELEETHAERLAELWAEARAERDAARAALV